MIIITAVVFPQVMSSGGASMLDIHPSLVFIDSSHIYEDALFDMVTWWKKLQPWGRMAIHDTIGDHPGVRAALLKFEQLYGLHLEIPTGSISWLTKGV
jgi:hypothetical protein